MRIIALLLLLILLPFTATAQSSIDEAAKRALIVGRTLQQERVFLQFDNTAYYLGETMWFKAHVTYGNNDSSSNLSKVLYVELVSPEGYIVESKKYKLDDNGRCHGDFELKPSFLSGYYEIRAYTRYMLNWGDDVVFSRVFPIFDKVNADNWDFKNMFDRKRNNSATDSKGEIRLSFYPEGGHLVNGVECRVAYEMFSATGTFANETIVICENDKPIIETAPQHYGKGLFSFTPNNHAKYKAKVKTKTDKGEKSFYFDLPEIENEGVTINVTQTTDTVLITIHSRYSLSRELGFAVLYRGNMGYYKKFDTNNEIVEFAIDKKNLLEGVCRAVVFSDELPLAERQFFVYHNDLQKGDRETARLKVKTNDYIPYNLNPESHQKITLLVEREDGKPIEEDAEFSISVTDVAGKQITSWDYNMYTYMLLGSELKGYIPNASQYFDSSNEMREVHLDLLMLTHGWTSYDWDKLMETSFADLQPVEKGITLKGAFYRLRNENKITGKANYVRFPEAYNPVRFDILGNDGDILASVFRTDSLGRFMMEMEDFYGTRVASLSPDVPIKFNENIRYAFVLDRYFSPEAKELHYWEHHTGKPYEELAQQPDSFIKKVNPLEYVLDGVDVIAAMKKESYARPPLSELRLDYLEEWEYAKDITFMPGKGNGDLEMDSTERAIWEEIMLDSIAQKEMGLGDNDELLYFNDMMAAMDKISMAERMPEYRDVITANNVLRSVFSRYKLPWCYWVHSIVQTKDYHSDSIICEDREYLHGKDPDKMTNFKEIVIRSDKPSRKLFYNGNGGGFWELKKNALENKFPKTDFYKGFLTLTCIYPRSEELKNEVLYTSYDKLRVMRTAAQMGNASNQMSYPNYVACFIPHKPEDKRTGIIPDFTNSYSAQRYTSVKGYTECKHFYSPDYSNMQPDASLKDYRRTLLWIPTAKAQDGKITVEFYNSTCCNGIEVEVSGRQNNIFFSNDDITRNRVGEESVVNVKKASEKSYEKRTLKADSVALAQYAEEYAKGIVYYKMKKYQSAIKIFAELQQYDYLPAVRSVAICYREGHGVKKNDALSAEFLLRAVELGDEQSMYDVAMLYKKGIGVEQSDEKTIYWLNRAVEYNEPRAQSLLGYYYATGTILEKNVEKAAGLLRASALQGNAEGLYHFGLYIADNIPTKSDEQLGSYIDCIEKAAGKQHIEAMLYIMKHYADNANYEQSYLWAKKLHQVGNKEGTHHMAHCYMNGLGVKRNKKLAKDLYREVGIEK